MGAPGQRPHLLPGPAVPLPSARLVQAVKQQVLRGTTGEGEEQGLSNWTLPSGRHRSGQVCRHNPCGHHESRVRPLLFAY